MSEIQHTLTLPVIDGEIDYGNHTISVETIREWTTERPDGTLATDPPSEVVDLILQAADDKGWTPTPDWTWDYWAGIAEDEIEILVTRLDW